MPFLIVGCGSKTVYVGFNDTNSSDKIVLSETESSAKDRIEHEDETFGDSIAEHIVDEEDQNTEKNSTNDDEQDQTESIDNDNYDDIEKNSNNDDQKDETTLLETPECSTTDDTRSVLLSETISRELVQKELLYEIYALDCAGKPIEDGYIDFSFEYLTNEVQSFTYKILDPETDEILSSGILDLVMEQQIDSYYFRTDKEINFGDKSKFLLSVDLSSIIFTEPQGSNVYDQLPTFLRIGKYLPNQQNVKLLEIGCKTEQESRVSALTEELDVGLNTANNISLEYQLFSKDCLGNSIDANQILFDLDYRFDVKTGEEISVSYSIVDEENQQVIGSGSLILIRGEDLFGNSGQNFFYYKSDGSFEFPAEWKKLKLIINWTNVVFLNPTSEDSDPNVLPSFIKFGQNLDPAKKDIILNFIP